MHPGYAIIAALIEVVYALLDFAIWALVVGAVLSWLIAFNVVNSYNPVVRTVNGFLFRLTEPLLRPLRRFIPPAGGLDLSPLALIFIIYFLQSFLRHLMQ